MIEAFGIVKKACSSANMKFNLESQIVQAIHLSCDDIIHGRLHDQFLLSIFESKSGTQLNINVNEVIANRANEILRSFGVNTIHVHPHDHVNKNQSSFDTFLIGKEYFCKMFLC
jgi:fumarate hydratase class II